MRTTYQMIYLIGSHLSGETDNFKSHLRDIHMKLLVSSGIFILFVLSSSLSAQTDTATEKIAADASSPALTCLKRSRLYIPVQSVAPNLGKAAGDRKGFLDSKYGSGAWIAVEKSGVDIRDTVLHEKSTKPVAITISTDKPEYSYTKAAVIVETRLDYSEDGNNSGQRLYYTQLAEYAIEKNSIVELLIPYTAIKGNGAILVVLTRSDSRILDLVVKPVSYDRCIQQIYVKDRRTAIRLNRGR